MMVIVAPVRPTVGTRKPDTRTRVIRRIVEVIGVIRRTENYRWPVVMRPRIMPGVAVAMVMVTPVIVVRLCGNGRSQAKREARGECQCS